MVVCRSAVRPAEVASAVLHGKAKDDGMITVRLLTHDNSLAISCA
jgi:hypothetical protein